MVEVVTKIRAAWEAASKDIRESPQALADEFPSLSPEQLDEAVETYCKWAERVAPPHGFKPVASLAKTLLTVEADKLLAALERFPNATEWDFSFVEPLARGLSFVSLSAVFSDKQEGRRWVAEQGGKLLESLTLMDTAQVELSKKLESMKEADAIIEKLRLHEGAIASDKQKADEACAAIEEAKGKADESSDSIYELEESAKILQAEVRTTVADARKVHAENQEFAAKLAKQAEEIDALKIKAAEQSKLISDLLPGATGAGLAAAYGDRARSLLPSIKMWRTIFITSICVLAAGSAILVWLAVGQSDDVWKYFLLRLPVVLPIIWMGWFSAIQYGNAMRLEEHYSFKEATSKAFAGYREHIAHLGAAESRADGEPSGQDVATLLAASTVNILSKPPAEVFSPADKEASPVNQILATIMSMKGKAGKSE